MEKSVQGVSGWDLATVRRFLANLSLYHREVMQYFDDVTSVLDVRKSRALKGEREMRMIDWSGLGEEAPAWHLEDSR